MASMCGSIYYGGVRIGEITQMPTISEEECCASTLPMPKVATVTFTCTFNPAIDRLCSVLSEEARREQLDLYRGEWWKRGEGEPEYLADLYESEWWTEGDGPPDYDMAA